MASELTLKTCGTILRELMSKKHRDYAWPFYDPIDANHLHLLDYYSVITRPMDLGTVRKKLLSGAYECADNFVSDVRLVFCNAYTYTKTPQHEAYAKAKMLENVFEELLSKAQHRSKPPIEKMPVEVETSGRNVRKGRPTTKATDADPARSACLVVPGVIGEGTEQISAQEVNVETVEPESLPKKRGRKPARSLGLAEKREASRVLPKRGKRGSSVPAGVPTKAKKESSVCSDLLATVNTEPAASPELPNKIKKEAPPSIELPKKATAASTRVSNKTEKESAVKKNPAASSGRGRKTAPKKPDLPSKGNTNPCDDNKENMPPKAAGAKRGPKPRSNEGHVAANAKECPPPVASQPTGGNIKNPSILTDQRSKENKKASLERKLLKLAFNGFRPYGSIKLPCKKLIGLGSSSSESSDDSDSDSSSDSSSNSSSDSSSSSSSSSSSDDSNAN